MVKNILYFSGYIAMILAAVALAVYQTGTYAIPHPFFVENSWIEQFTVIFFLSASLVAAGFFIVQQKTKMIFIFSALMALAAFREMDWHKKWTSDSILKSKFYVLEATPIQEKIIGGMVIAFLVYALILLMFSSKKWVLDIYRGKLVAWGVFFGLGSLVGAKILDSFSRLVPALNDFKITYEIVFLGLEETMEMIAASIFLFLAVMLWRQQKN